MTGAHVSTRSVFMVVEESDLFEGLYVLKPGAEVRLEAHKRARGCVRGLVSNVIGRDRQAVYEPGYIETSTNKGTGE